MTDDARQYWWLSFVDRVRDEELDVSAAAQLGVAIVLARDFGQAVGVAWMFLCNPGGEVAGTPLGIGRETGLRDPQWRSLTHRLLAEPDITEAQIWLDHERERAL
jgi:hypothetical protein